MTIMQATAAIVLSLLVPFAVQLIKTEAMTGKAARILALGCSLLAGVVPASWAACPQTRAHGSRAPSPW
ncbi:MAG: hypothetical protein UFD57_07510 [Collinsella sp.]|nr:hypothetical protein [Collinsella sp.]